MHFILRSNIIVLNNFETHIFIKLMAFNFDLVVVNVFPTNEVGHYIAHKHGSPSVIFSTYQATVPFFDQALGNSINTATTTGAFGGGTTRGSKFFLV